MIIIPNEINNRRADQKQFTLQMLSGKKNGIEEKGQQKPKNKDPHNDAQEIPDACGLVIFHVFYISALHLKKYTTL